MGNERVIFSNRFDRPTLEQIEKEMKNENYDDNENLMSAEEFLDFMKKNRKTVPNEKRIANKDKFIWAVRELSETYEIDADLIEDDDGYTASLYMSYASYQYDRQYYQIDRSVTVKHPCLFSDKNGHPNLHFAKQC